MVIESKALNHEAIRLRGDLQVHELHDRLMRGILKHSRAKKGALIVNVNEELWLSVLGNFLGENYYDTQSRRQRLNAAIESIVPASLIRKAAESNTVEKHLQSLNESSLFQDPYLKEARPNTLFCAPIISEDSILGVLYLEDLQIGHLSPEDADSFLQSWLDQAAACLEIAKQIRRLQEELTLQTHKLNVARGSKKRDDQAGINFMVDLDEEIRSPINSILGFSRLMLKKSRQLRLPASFKTYLENIQSSGTRLSELIDNIFQYSRIESGQVESTHEHIDIRHLLMNTVKTCRDQVEKHNCSLKISNTDVQHDEIYLNRTVFNRMMIILIKAVVRKIPPKTILELSSSVTDNELKICISASNLSSAETGRIRSAINGLKNQEDKSFADFTIARKLLHKQHGTVSFSQEIKDGTLLHLTLPVKRRQIVQPSNPGKLALSKDEQVLMENSLHTLAKTPIFMGRTVLNEIKRIKQSDVIRIPIIREELETIECAVFEGNRELFNSTLDKLSHDFNKYKSAGN